MDAELADRVGDGVAEVDALVQVGLQRLAAAGVGGGEDLAAVQREGERRREEARDRDHVRGIEMKVQVLIADVGHPIEVAHDPVREAVAPGAEQHRAEHVERRVGEDRRAEGERHVQTHAELARDLDLSQRPGAERAERTNRNDLPQAAIGQRRPT